MPRHVRRTRTQGRAVAALFPANCRTSGGTAARSRAGELSPDLCERIANGMRTHCERILTETETETETVRIYPNPKRAHAPAHVHARAAGFRFRHFVKCLFSVSVAARSNRETLNRSGEIGTGRTGSGTGTRARRTLAATRPADADARAGGCRPVSGELSNRSGGTAARSRAGTVAPVGARLPVRPAHGG